MNNYFIKRFILIFFIICHAWPLAGQEIQLVPPSTYYEAIQNYKFSPDGKYVYIASQYSISVWEVSTGKLLRQMRITGHEDLVSDVVFSEDLTLAVSNSCFDDKTARIWSISDGKLIGVLQGHTKDISAAKFSWDGKYIVTKSYDNTVRVWDVTTGSCLHTITDRFYGEILNFTPDSNYLFLSKQFGGIDLWSIPEKKKLNNLPNHVGTYSTMEFSPDGEYAAFSVKSSINIMKKPFRSVILVLRPDDPSIWDVTSLSFSNDNKLLVAGYLTGSVCIWDLSNGKSINQVNNLGRQLVGSACFSPDGKYFGAALWSDSIACVWETSSGELVHKFKANKQMVFIKYSPDGKYIMTYAYDKILKLWSAEDGRPYLELPILYPKIEKIRFIDTLNQAMILSADNSIRFWDFSNGELLPDSIRHTGNEKCAQVSPDGKYVITKMDGKVCLTDMNTHKSVYTLNGYADLQSVCFNREGTYICLICSNAVIIIRASDGAIISNFSTGNLAYPTTVSFHPDGNSLLIATHNKRMMLYDIVSNSVVQTVSEKANIISAEFNNTNFDVLTTTFDMENLKSGTNVWDMKSGNLKFSLTTDENTLRTACYSPDRKYILTTPGLVWSASDGKLLFKLGKDNNDIIFAIWSPEGESIATASENGIISVWDAMSGTFRCSLKEKATQASSVRFSSDGKIIMVIADDGSITVWSAFTGNLLLRNWIYKNKVYITLHASGLFYAPEEAKKLLYWISDTKVVPNEEIFDRYWEKGLWEKVMQGEKLRIP